MDDMNVDRQNSARAGNFVKGLLTLLVLGLICGSFVLGRVTKSDNDTSPATPSPSDLTFLCDVSCVKDAAKLQGADILSELGSVKFNIDVTFSGGVDRGEGCGANHTFPAYTVTIDPSCPVKLTTAQTRVVPKVTFECDPSKAYHLLFEDTLGGKFQDVNAYNHWLRLNIECHKVGLTGIADTSHSGVDMVQGSPNIPGWFSGRGYLPPAFGYNTMHHFNFFVFETDAALSATRLAEIDADFPSHNNLGNFSNPAYTVKQIASWLNFTAPVARTWVDVTTSYWSAVRMERLAAIFPPIKDQAFFKAICPCNLPSNQQGTGSADSVQCNL